MTFKPIKLFAGRPDVKPHNEDDYETSNSNFIYYHNSKHRFEPGDIINPTTSINQARINQGMDDDEAEEYAEDDPEHETTPRAWAAGDPDYMKTYHRYTYEVEPITGHSRVHADPVGWKNGEFAASEGYRVRQMIWDKSKDSCPTCDGEGRTNSDTPPYYPNCQDCHGTGMSTSKIVGLQKAGYKLDEIKKYNPRGQ